MFSDKISTFQALTKSCLHCSRPFVPIHEKDSLPVQCPQSSPQRNEFCCHGCFGSYQLIHSLGLSDYYTLREQSSLSRFEESFSSAAIYDEEIFKRSFCEQQEDGKEKANFSISGLHCFACVWLCEKALAAKHPEVTPSINFAKKRLSLQYQASSSKLSTLVIFFQDLGFHLEPYQHESAHLSMNVRDELIPLACSFLSASQIMIFSLADYFSGGAVSGPIRPLFLAASLGFASISLFYCAQSYLLSLLRFLRSGKISLDIPISIAFLSSYFYSLWSVYSGHGAVYFDSLSFIIFLLLAGRYLKNRQVEKIDQQISSIAFNSSRKGEGEFVQASGQDGKKTFIALEKIKKGMTIYLVPHELLPLRAELVSPEQAELSVEPMTGELRSLVYKKGNSLNGGLQNGSRPLELKALEDGLVSQLYKHKTFLEELYHAKGSYTLWAERLSLLFFWFMLLAGAAVLLYWLPKSPETAFYRFIGVMIVACPCVFSLCLPLVYGLSFSEGLKAGLIFKNQAAIEKMSQVKKIFFDKTGTLTKGRPHITRAILDEKKLSELGLSRNDALNIFRELALSSQHHHLLGLIRWAEEESPPTPKRKTLRISKVKEQLGEGITFELENEKRTSFARLGRSAFALTDKDTIKSPSKEPASLYFSLDGNIIGSFILEDEPLEGVRAELALIRQKGFEIQILTGDGAREAHRIGTLLDFREEEISHSLSPAEKQNIILAEKKFSAMVGNGLNDAMALGSSCVGIAVLKAHSLAKNQADIILLREDLSLLHQTSKISKKAVNAIKKAFFVSTVYNLLSLSLALTGRISPLVAAILMPINSLLVLMISTFWARGTALATRPVP
ncbi:MAG: heavy metal translocating P-type ATPase metal-binding domain-containing protein [Oligoflexales bacterium]|nr:heavy metal translocating P-type ATPase metal-binding domain-containing protein [Oligoflexales bacterium]